MMNALLATIVAVLCALAAGMAAGGIAWVALEMFGVGRKDGRAMKLGMLIFGLPAGLAGFWYGYVLGANMVPDHMRTETPAATVVANAL